ncbi:MAG TPA: YfcE family phosphodiesterase [Myxococcota bacterium]|jgi:putative phosphoesterase|nr:YfcE family phosphodiesterase [Myxococcota bacterium]
MRIGVVSDTHNHLPNVRRIVELFRAAGVSRVIHTGDITQAKTLDAFAHLGVPLYGVFGNNDVERDSLLEAARRHGIALVDPPLRLVWAERRIVVVHDPRELATLDGDDHHVALHGHVHRQVIERRATGRLVFNPGECAGHVPGLNAVGVLDLATLEPEILRF